MIETGLMIGFSRKCESSQKKKEVCEVEPQKELLTSSSSHKQERTVKELLVQF